MSSLVLESMAGQGVCVCWEMGEETTFVSVVQSDPKHGKDLQRRDKSILPTHIISVLLCVYSLTPQCGGINIFGSKKMGMLDLKSSGQTVNQRIVVNLPRYSTP